MTMTYDERFEAAWDRVCDALKSAYSIQWDGCHKIYVLMDEDTHDTHGWSDEGDLNVILEGAPIPPLDYVGEWWDVSCPLRFINAIQGDEYIPLIEQGELCDDDEEDDDA